MFIFWQILSQAAGLQQWQHNPNTNATQIDDFLALFLHPINTLITGGAALIEIIDHLLH